MNLQTTFKALVSLLVALVLYLAVILTYGTATDFRPQAVLPLEAEQSAELEVIADSVLSFVIWNLGYGGLGEESDFFYDRGNLLFSGGGMVRPSREMVEKNNKGIEELIGATRSDFFLLQEVDVHSRRSYFQDQYEQSGRKFPGWYKGFAPNYRAPLVSIPLLEPWQFYGSVNSGLATISRFQPLESVRYQLPGAFSWPTRIFQLDRCVSVHRLAQKNGKELIVLNIHNSAHDDDGELKYQEMEFIRELCLAEYQKGNYVVAGGDWNMCPPFFPFDRFMPGQSQGNTQLNIDPAFFPEEWRWVYDPAVPTNRKTKTPYRSGETFVTTIDFFLISPNVKVLNIKVLNHDFRYSDHQPVWMEVAFN